MTSRTIADFEARAQKIRVFDLHESTPWNGSAEKPLVGKVLPVSSYKAVWLWFTPDGTYDGIVVFEVSPDGGTTWFGIQGYNLTARTTLIANIASPVLSDSVIIPVPSNSNFRARLTAGSQGNLSVQARLVDIDQP